MAYASGTVNSLNEYYDALDSFVTSYGWTVIDTISTRDKVYHSAGLDGNHNFYVRLTSSAEAGNPYLPNSVHKYSAHVLTRGYQSWDTVAHSGLKEFGQIGPLRLYNRDSVFRYGMIQPDWNKAQGIQLRALDANLPAFDSSYRYYFSEFRTQLFRKEYNSDIWIGIFDLITGSKKSLTSSWSGVTVDGNFANSEMVYILQDDGDLVCYGITGASSDTNNFYKYNITKSQLTALTKPTTAGVFAGEAGTGTRMVYDGGDFIYVIRGRGTNQFAAYSISGNSWIAKANLPINIPDYSSRGSMVYLHGSATGLAYDMISTIGAGSDLYTYNVSTDTWSTLSSKLPVYVQPWEPYYFNQMELSSSCRDAALHLSRTTGKCPVYKASVNSSGVQGFSLLGYDSYDNNSEKTGISNYNPLASKVKVSSTLPTQYWFMGDADSIKAVSKIGDNYFWMHFGKINSSYKPTVMKATAYTPAGLDAIITVNDTSNYTAGDRVDVILGEHGEAPACYYGKFIIKQVAGPTTLVADLTIDIPNSALIGVDPHRLVLTGDSGFAVTLLDSSGYASDSPYTNPTYYTHAQTFSQAEMTKLNPNGGGQVVPVQLKIFNSYPEYKGTYELRGFVPTILFLTKASSPSPQVGDFVPVNGKQYLVIESAYTAIQSEYNYLTLLGPAEVELLG